MDFFKLLGLFITFSGFVGMIIHGSLTTTEKMGPTLENHFLGVWFSGLVFLIGWELLRWEFNLLAPYCCFTSCTNSGKGGKGDDRSGCCYNVWELNVRRVVHLVIGVCLLLAMIRYCALPDAISVFWSLFGTVGELILLYRLFTHQPESNFNSSDRGIGFCLLVWLSELMLMVALFFSILLAYGAFNAAFVQSLTNPGTAPGKILALTQTDGRPVRIHVYCLGPVVAGVPPIWLIADAAHGVTDFFGLQNSLSSTRRVCSMDNPGFGWSPDLYPSQTDYAALFWTDMLEKSGEALPAIFAGMGGGGSTIMRYQALKPDYVSKVIFLYVYPPGIEFLTWAYGYSYDSDPISSLPYSIANPVKSSDQIAAYRAAQFVQRLSLVQLILGLAIPWGLMPVFNPVSTVPATYYPADKALLFKSQSWTSKFWLAQQSGLRQFATTSNDNSDPLYAYPIARPASTPLSAILCTQSDDTICANFANTTYGASLSSTDFAKECAYRKGANRLTIDAQFSMTRALHPNPTFVNVSSSTCGIYNPVDQPQQVANLMIPLL